MIGSPFAVGGIQPSESLVSRDNLKKEADNSKVCFTVLDGIP